MDPRRDAIESPLPLWRVLEDEFRELHSTGSEPEWRRQWQTELDRLTPDSAGGGAGPADFEALLHQLVHRLPEDQARTAVCLSGGGIRSASFGLGVLQGLARHGLLARFHYLSTVSGGG